MLTQEEKEAKWKESHDLSGADGPNYRTEGDLEQVKCPKCEEFISLGPGALGNVVYRHMDSKTCIDTQKRKGKIALSLKPPKTTMLSFFSRKQKVPKVATTIAQPATISIQAAVQASSGSKHNSSSKGDGTDGLGPGQLSDPTTPAITVMQNSPVISNASVQQRNEPGKLNLEGYSETWRGLASIAGKLAHPGPGTANDYLSGFEGPPHSHDDPGVEDPDVMETIVNPLCHRVFGYDNQLEEKQVVGLKPERLQGILAVLHYFVEKRGIGKELLEGRLTRLLDAVRKWGCIRDADYSSHIPLVTAETAPMAPQVRQQDSGPESIELEDHAVSATPEMLEMTNCNWYHVDIPGEASPYVVYPFGLHQRMNLPWDCAVADGQLFLRSKTCSGKVEVGRDASACRSCCVLARNNALKGIVQRMKDGVREGTGYAYHGIGGLQQLLRIKTKQIQFHRLRHLNHARKLARKMRALGDHKRFLAAIASGKLERVDKIVRLGLRQGRSVKHMVSQYMKAAKGLYKPKDYQEEDYLRGLVLWKLGGNRLASFGHHALGLPSITTLKNQVRIPPVRVSTRRPTVEEISTNTEEAFTGLDDVLKPTPSCPVNHAVQMFDELATEARLRWCLKTNRFVGLCRAHGDTVPSKFETEEDLEEVFRGVDEGRVHLGREPLVHPC